MPKIKKDELERVMNSISKPKKVVLPANQKSNKKTDIETKTISNKPTIFLIDGYNLLYSIDELNTIASKDLISARNKVIDIVCDFQGYSGCECVLVFDAYNNMTSVPTITKDYNIALVYTKAGQTADMYIEQKSNELINDYKVYVVTSDALEQLRVFSNNSLRMSCREFMKKYNNYKESKTKNTKKTRIQPMKELRKLLFED